MDEKRLAREKRCLDPKIKITGYRDKVSKIQNMKAIANEKGIPVSHAYAEAVSEYIFNNIPKI